MLKNFLFYTNGAFKAICSERGDIIIGINIFQGEKLMKLRI